MTLGTITLVTLTGSLVLLKLALMGFALALLVRSLFPTRRITRASPRAGPSAAGTQTARLIPRQGKGTMADPFSPQAEPTGKHRKRASLTLILLAGLWWVISDGSSASWLIGLPALAAAGWASTRLGGLSESHISSIGLVRFVPLFFWESLRGGVDVALRTLTPRMRIQPGFIHYRCTLPNLSARTFFTNCVSLLPGTLAADLHGEWLEIHVLNLASDNRMELARLERAITHIFKEPGTTK